MRNHYNIGEGLKSSLYSSAFQTASADISPPGAPIDYDAGLLQVGFPGAPVLVLSVAAKIAGHATLVADDAPGHTSYPL